MRHAIARRFHAGQTGEVDGIPFRILRGKKKPDDLVLELYAGGQWRRIRMDLGFLLAAFFFENEEVLYPPSGRRQIGGDYYMRECWDAIYYGWESAAQKLRQERAQRVQRLMFANTTPEEVNFEHKYPRLKAVDRTMPPKGGQ